MIHNQQRDQYRIGELEKLTINAKKEFNAGVKAAVFFCSTQC